MTPKSKAKPKQPKKPKPPPNDLDDDLDDELDDDDLDDDDEESNDDAALSRLGELIEERVAKVFDERVKASRKGSNQSKPKSRDRSALERLLFGE